ncbi:MAG: C25 family cysteine peptidase [bacterium]
MKNLSLVVALMLATAAMAGGVTESFEFSASAVTFGTQDGYATVTIPGAPHTFPLGTPDLPALPYTVVIPADAEATGIEILELVETPLMGAHDLLPVQHPVPFSIDPVKQPFVEPNPAVYGQDATWPPAPAVFGRTHNKGGFRVASFALHPLRYNPVTKQLTLVTKIRVRVNYDRGTRPTPRRSAIQNEVHAEGLRRLVLNPGDVARSAPATRATARGSFLLPAGEYEHVIITPELWVDSFAQLVEWRTRQGWRSRVMTLEDITTAYPGRDVPEKMRNFLKDADTTWGLVFAFIARDDYPSGANQVRQVRAYSYNMKSDMYFSDLDGDWDTHVSSKQFKSSA